MVDDLARVIQSAQNGDREAFHQLYQQHLGRVFAICLRLLGDRQRAEDGCQEVFIKAWKQLPGFRGDSSFSTWLHSLATRTAIDLWRQDKLLRLVDVNSAAEPVIESNCAENQDLEQAIQKLPAQARAVFVLFALEGYQHQQIADLLNIAEGTSKAHYHRARQLLREHLRVG